MQRVAVISYHTSPLAQPGVGDGGGMNVYVRELVSSLAHVGIKCTVYTRETSSDTARVVDVEPNHRVVHIPAGSHTLSKDELIAHIDDFAEKVIEDIKANGGVDVVHANYWMSAVAGHKIKHELNIPLVTTFHTLARVKAQGGDHESAHREQEEIKVIGCTDVICVSCTEEQRQFVSLYGKPSGTLEIVAPGVEHAFFTPGSQHGARHALGLDSDPTLLFVGRIQPLKGIEVAIRALKTLHTSNPHLSKTRLMIVGGASGTEGDAEVRRINDLIDELGIRDRIMMVPPQEHHALSTYYRAADAVLVPSRSESFGLVALEAAACGVPVIASAVGGLLTLVEHGKTGYLVPDRDPAVYAGHIAHLLNNRPLAAEMGAAAATRARRYTWSFAAARLRRVYADLINKARVECV